MATESAPGYNNGKYSFQQQVFSLSWATSLSFNLRGSAEEIASETRRRLNAVFAAPAIRELIGVWTLVWGPGVYADSYIGASESLNAMFIAVPEQDPVQAVVAISGTNGSSLMDWMIEDFNVGHKTPWPFGHSPLHPEISAGTFFGLDKLVSMRAADALGHPPVTARQFLADQSFAKIMVTGHSLGGALSPCYTLYLDETRSAWDPSSGAALACMPTAGPTPGDVNFSTYYDARLLASTTRIWNAMDIVPHAFNTATLEQIPTLYEPELYSATIAKLVAALQRWTAPFNYLNVLPESQGFPSKFYTLDDFRPRHKNVTDEIDRISGKLATVLKSNEPTAPQRKTFFWTPPAPRSAKPTDAMAFIVQALIQHTIGYLVFFGVEAFSTLMSEHAKPSDASASSSDAPDHRLKNAWSDLHAPLLLDLGEQPAAKIEELNSGQGPLLSEIFDKIAEAGKGRLHEGAQSVVFLVEESRRSTGRKNG